MCKWDIIIHIHTKKILHIYLSRVHYSSPRIIFEKEQLQILITHGNFLDFFPVTIVKTAELPPEKR